MSPHLRTPPHRNTPFRRSKTRLPASPAETSTRQSPLGEFIAALLLAPHRARLAAALIPQNRDQEQQPRRLLLRGELLLPLYPAQSRI